MVPAYIIGKNPKLTSAGRIYILRGFIGIGLSGTLFFLAAGRLDIPRGWIYFITTALVIYDLVILN